MHDIQIRFEADLSGAPDFTHIAQVEVPVEVIDANLETIVEETRSLYSPLPIQVPTEGRYQVRVRLPSGERVSAMVTVPAETGGPPVAMLRSKDYSQHETLAWAYTVQGIKRAAGLPGGRGGREERRVREEPRDDKESIAPSEPAAFGPMYEIAGWSEAQDFWEFAPLPEVASVRGEAVPDDRRVALRWRGARPEWAEKDPHEWRPGYQRYTHGGRASGVALFAVPPCRWTDMLLVETGEARGTGLRPLSGGSNPQADALLSYLCQGAFAAARQTGEGLAAQLDTMLGGKGDDPTSAVVAGYFMLKASYIRHEDWLEKLAVGFEGLPDGAVIFGWCLLHRAEPDYAGARHFFLTASRRGIPMYSPGLRLLYDGLNFSLDRNRDDKEVYRMFKAVRRVAATADWNTDVTSFSLPEADFT